MFRAGIVELVREDPTVHGFFEEHARTYRRVRCSIKSVTQNEQYTAMSQGINPACIFILPHAWEYKNERLLRFEGQGYRVIRTYVNGDAIELTAERVEYNV